MNCFTCTTEHGTTSTATGFCVACGAAICAGHTTVDPVLAGVTTLGNPVRAHRPGRALHCPDCAGVVAAGGILTGA